MGMGKDVGGDPAGEQVAYCWWTSLMRGWEKPCLGYMLQEAEHILFSVCSV